MKLIKLLWPLLLFSCKTSRSDTSQVLESAIPSRTILGLNDVAILVPHTFDVNFASKVPSPFDKPDPARFAAGAQALPLDGKAFIPSEVLKGIADELAKDTAVLNVEQQRRLGFLNTQDIVKSDASIATLDKTHAQNFKLIAMRIDPCSNFAILKSVTPACSREIRITWQKVKLGNYFHAEAESFHSMHTLDDATFKSFVAGLRALRAKAGPSDPKEQLSPHPVIRAEGPNSPYFAGLMGLVHRYIRASNLSGVSMHHEAVLMNKAPWTRHWSMTAVGVKNGLPVHVDLPLMAEQNPKRFAQRHSLDLDVPWPSWKPGNPWTEGGSMWHDRFIPSPARAGAGTIFDELDHHEGARVTAYKNSWIVQNPLTHHRQNTDCGTCHIAAYQQDKNENLIHGMASKTKAERDEILKRPAGAYVSKTWNTEAAYLDRGFFGESRSGTADSLQMFGYLGADWIVMRHVNNDAALSADLLKDL